MLRAAKLLASANRQSSRSHISLRQVRSRAKLLRQQPLANCKGKSVNLRSQRPISREYASKKFDAAETLRSEVEANYGAEIAADPEVQAIITSSSVSSAVQSEHINRGSAPSLAASGAVSLPLAFLSRREVDLLQAELDNDQQNDSWRSEWETITQAAGVQLQRRHLEPVLNFLEALPEPPSSIAGTAAGQRELARIAASHAEVKEVLDKHCDSLPEPAKTLIREADSRSRLEAALATLTVQRLGTILAHMNLSDAQRSQVGAALQSPDPVANLRSQLHSLGYGLPDSHDTQLADVAAAVRARGSPVQRAQLSALVQLQQQRMQAVLDAAEPAAQRLLPPSEAEEKIASELKAQVNLLLRPIPKALHTAVLDQLPAAARKVASEMLAQEVTPAEEEPRDSENEPGEENELAKLLSDMSPTLRDTAMEMSESGFSNEEIEADDDRKLLEKAEKRNSASTALVDVLEALPEEEPTNDSVSQLEELLHERWLSKFDTPAARGIEELILELQHAAPEARADLQQRLDTALAAAGPEGMTPIEQMFEEAEESTTSVEDESKEPSAAGSSKAAAGAASAESKDDEDVSAEDTEALAEGEELDDDGELDEDGKTPRQRAAESAAFEEAVDNGWNRPPLPAELEPLDPFSTDLPDHRMLGPDPRLPYRKVLRKLLALFNPSPTAQADNTFSLSAQLIQSIVQHVYPNPNTSATLATLPSEKLKDLLASLEKLGAVSAQLNKPVSVASVEDRGVSSLLSADLDDRALRAQVDRLIAEQRLHETAVSPLIDEESRLWEGALDTWRKRFRNDPEYEAGRKYLEARRLQTLLSEEEDDEEEAAPAAAAVTRPGSTNSSTTAASGGDKEKDADEEDADEEDDAELAEDTDSKQQAPPTQQERDAAQQPDPGDLALDEALASGAELTPEMKQRLKHREMQRMWDEKRAFDADEEQIMDIINTDTGEVLGEVTERQNISSENISLEQALRQRSSKLTAAQAQKLFNALRPQANPFNDVDHEVRARHEAVGRAYEVVQAESSKLLQDVADGKVVDQKEVHEILEKLQDTLSGAERVMAAEKMRDPTMYELQESLRVVAKYLPEDGDSQVPLTQADWEAEDRRLLEDLAHANDALADPTGEVAWHRPNRLGLRPRDLDAGGAPFFYRTPFATPEQRYRSARLGVNVSPKDPRAAQLHDLQVRARRGELSEEQLRPELTALGVSVDGMSFSRATTASLEPLFFAPAPNADATDAMQSWIAHDRNWRLALSELDDSAELAAVERAVEASSSAPELSTSPGGSASTTDASASVSAHAAAGASVSGGAAAPDLHVVQAAEDQQTIKLHSMLAQVDTVLAELEQPDLVQQQAAQVYMRWMSYVMQCRRRVRMAEGRNPAREGFLPTRRAAGQDQPQSLSEQQVGHWEETLHRMLLPAKVFRESDFPSDVRAEVEADEDELEQLGNWLTPEELRTFRQRKREEEHARVATLMTVAEQEAWRQRQRMKSLYRHWQRAKRQQWAALLAQREQLQQRLSQVRALSETAEQRSSKETAFARIDAHLDQAIPDAAKSAEALQMLLASGGRGTTPSEAAKAHQEVWDRLSGEAGPLHAAANAAERIRQAALEADLASLKPPADAPADEKAEHNRVQELFERFRQQLTADAPLDSSAPGFGLRSLAQDEKAAAVAREIQAEKRRSLLENLQTLEQHFVLMLREKRSLSADQRLLARQAQLMLERESELQRAKQQVLVLTPGSTERAKQQLLADQLEHRQREDIKMLQKLRELIEARELRVEKGLHPANLKHMVHTMATARSDELLRLQEQLRTMTQQRLDEDEKLQRTPPLAPEVASDAPEALLHRLRSQQEQKPRTMSLNDLKFFRAYPARVQEWVLDAKMPKGGFVPSGRWGVLPETERDRYDDLVRVNPKPRMQVDPDAPLAPDLEGHYRFGVTAQELDELNIDPKLRKLLSFRYANKWEINDFRREQATKKWQRTSYDTGSTEVQIAVLSDRINYLSEHIARHHKDKSSARKLRILINKRRRFLRYMREQDAGVYQRLLKDLNLRDYAWLAPPA